MAAVKVLQASASMLNLLGVSSESSEYVQKQMATLLGLSDETKMAQVAKLWEEAYHCKRVVERGERDIFAHEAKLTGLKYSGDLEKYEKEKALLVKLKDLQSVNVQRFKAASEEAQRMQDEAANDRF